MRPDILGFQCRFNLELQYPFTYTYLIHLFYTMVEAYSLMVGYLILTYKR